MSAQIFTELTFKPVSGGFRCNQIGDLITRGGTKRYYYSYFKNIQMQNLHQSNGVKKPEDKPTEEKLDLADLYRMNYGGI